MTAKIKAAELVEKFYKKNCEILEKDGTTPFEEIEQEIAKSSALIAVEEILNNIPKVKQLPSPNKPIVDFWNSVKNEINAL